MEGSYIYPEHDGFTLNTESQPISGNMALTVGTPVDRFGGETGSFLSPEGAPYMQRSIPPSKLGCGGWLCVSEILCEMDATMLT